MFVIFCGCLLNDLEKDKMLDSSNQVLHKYQCRACGCVEVAGGLDSYPIFRAEGEKLVYVRTVSYDADISSLTCAECGEDIEASDESNDRDGVIVW